MIYNKPRDLVILPEKAARKNRPGKGGNNNGEKVGFSKQKAVKVVAFFLTLYVGTAVAFTIPLRPAYSEIEKRNLKKFPEFTLEALKSGSYFDDIGTWFSDTFPFRESLTKMNSSLNRLSGFDSIAIHGDVNVGDDIPDVPVDEEETTAPPTTKPAVTVPPDTTEAQTTLPPTTEAQTSEATTAPTTKTPSLPGEKPIKTQTLGAILVAGNSGYEYYNFSSSLAEKFIKPVNSIKACAGGNANVYTLIVPTSMDIMLDESVRKDIASSDQKKALDYFNASFRDVIPIVTAYDTLMAHRNEYIYFRTDHHWTALGAYYAYQQFAYAKGITPVDISLYKTKTFDGFLGTFYSNSQSTALSKTPDSVTAYLPFNNASLKFTQSDGQVLSWPVITDVSNYKEGGKYLTFIAGDQPYEIIENADIAEGESCLVIKESYGNAFVPFLIPHYKTIHVIDPRHYKGTLSDFVAKNPVNDIVFIANVSTTRNNIYIDAMTNFIK